MAALSRRADVLKFQVVLERFCGCLDRVIVARYQLAARFMGLLLLFSRGKESRLDKIRKLKQKIRSETLKPNPRSPMLSRFQDRNGRATSGLDWVGSRNPSVGRTRVLPAQLESERQVRALVAVNQDLSTRIRQTERFIAQFIKDMEAKLSTDTSVTCVEPSTSKEN